MTETSSLSLGALIERLEKATGPDHDLDIDIARLRGVTVMLQRDDDSGADEDTYWHYTSSLDAALSLVPDEHGRSSAFHVQRTRSFGCCAVVWTNHEFNRSVRGDARTEALALCIAALKARASHQESSE